jgi:hypothetical protein
MADQPSARCWAGPMLLSWSIERWRCDVLLIAWIVRGSHDCRDAGKGANGRGSCELETTG